MGNGQYQAQGLASGKLLEVAGASTSNGAVIQIWPSNNNNCQKWRVIPACDGAAIIQWPYGGADNQQWRMSIAP